MYNASNSSHFLLLIAYKFETSFHTKTCNANIYININLCFILPKKINFFVTWFFLFIQSTSIRIFVHHIFHKPLQPFSWSSPKYHCQYVYDSSVYSTLSILCGIFRLPTYIQVIWSYTSHSSDHIFKLLKTTNQRLNWHLTQLTEMLVTIF